MNDRKETLPYNEKKRQENRQEDNKVKGKFVVIMILSMFLGGIFGASGVKIVRYMREQQWDFTVLGQNLTFLWSLAGRYLMLFLDLIFFPVMILLFKKHKKEVLAWDGEDEVRLDALERKLGMDMGIPTILTLLNMFFYGVGFYGMVYLEKKESPIFLLDLMLLLGGMLFLIFHQKNVINFIKELNPEKKGSIFDMRFNKKWFASCDEAERQKIGATCYATYRVMSLVYIFLTAALTLAGFFLPIGILPLTIVCLLWLTQTITYLVKCR